MMSSIKKSLPYIGRSMLREDRFPTYMIVIWAAISVINLTYANSPDRSDAWLVVVGVFLGFVIMELTARLGRGIREYRVAARAGA
jgi:hypothetical protein